MVKVETNTPKRRKSSIKDGNSAKKAKFENGKAPFSPKEKQSPKPSQKQTLISGWKQTPEPNEQPPVKTEPQSQKKDLKAFKGTKQLNATLTEKSPRNGANTSYEKKRKLKKEEEEEEEEMEISKVATKTKSTNVELQAKKKQSAGKKAKTSSWQQSVVLPKGKLANIVPLVKKKEEESEDESDAEDEEEGESSDVEEEEEEEEEEGGDSEDEESDDGEQEDSDIENGDGKDDEDDKSPTTKVEPQRKLDDSDNSALVHKQNQIIRFFVGNIPPDATKEDIMQHFAEISSDLTDFALPMVKSSNRHQGHCYLTMRTKTAQEKCLAMDQSELKGQKIIVLEHSRPQQKKGQESVNLPVLKVQFQRMEKKLVLFVNKIPQDATKDDVLQVFAEIGDDIVNFNLPMDTSNTQHRGYGFLEVKNDVAFEKCLSMHQSEVKGQPISVSRPHYAKNESKYTVVVKHIPREATEEDIMQHFVKIGCDIVNFALPLNEDGVQHQGHCFFDLKDGHAYKTCLAMSKTLLKGVNIFVYPADKQNNLKVFINKIPLNATKDDVKQHFEEISDDILDIHYPVDIFTGVYRGFAHMILENRVALDKCLSMNGSNLKGQQITVRLFKEKPFGQSRPRGTTHWRGTGHPRGAMNWRGATHPRGAMNWRGASHPRGAMNWRGAARPRGMSRPRGRGAGRMNRMNRNW